MKRLKCLALLPCLLALLAPACHWLDSAELVISRAPWVNDIDVTFYRGFEPEHGGVDLTATREITILAACDGKFRKELYYHPTSRRWQVNCDIQVGGRFLECFFEPGSQVSEETGRAQFDALVADGTEVRAGTVLGRLLLAPGNNLAILHFGVRSGSEFECPLGYCTDEVKAQLQALASRDHPGWEVCVGG